MSDSRTAIPGNPEPTWKDAHDALSAFVTTVVCRMSAESRDSAFARYTAIRDALTDDEDGRCGHRWEDPFGEMNECGKPPGHDGDHLAHWAVENGRSTDA